MSRSPHRGVEIQRGVGFASAGLGNSAGLSPPSGLVCPAAPVNGLVPAPPAPPSGLAGCPLLPPSGLAGWPLPPPSGFAGWPLLPPPNGLAGSGLAGSGTGGAMDGWSRAGSGGESLLSESSSPLAESEPEPGAGAPGGTCNWAGGAGLSPICTGPLTLPMIGAYPLLSGSTAARLQATFLVPADQDCWVRLFQITTSFLSLITLAPPE